MVLGIDFGTSHTVAALSGRDGHGRPMQFESSFLLPSAVYADTDGRLLVGRDAERSARLDPARLEPNPKRRIDDGVILLGSREYPVPDVTPRYCAASWTRRPEWWAGCPPRPC
jgi:molecular chaperone DnaK